MYTDIDTQHGLETICKWFDLNQQDLPPLYPVDAVIDGLAIIMERNAFQLGDSDWLQGRATAMGTSAACMYATIYYSYREETRVLTNDNKYKLVLYKRYIDGTLALQSAPSYHHQNDSLRSLEKSEPSQNQQQSIV